MACKRSYAIDNLRALLIICVVAGHLLEILPFSISRQLYALIYSFHMPAFAFVSGMCSKLDEKTPKRIARQYIYPYLVFQTLYQLYSNHILCIPVGYQYTTPYWLLWYLMSMIWWHGLLAAYSVVAKKWLASAAAFLIALLVGFNSSVGYFASLSRTFVLFPFFLGGYYAKDIGFFCNDEWKKSTVLIRGLRLIAVGASSLLCALIMIHSSKIHNKMIYHSYPYSMPEFGIVHRLIILLVAWLWIGALFALIPRVKIPWLTYCGQNTISIYLFHGFIIKLIEQVLPALQLNRHYLVFAVLAVLIPVVLSSAPFVKLYKFLMRFPFLLKEKLLEKSR